MIKKTTTLLLMCIAFITQAQTTTEPQMADTFRQDGKIYVVVTVIVLIFIAIVAFLIYLDRKLKKIEDSLKK